MREGARVACHLCLSLHRTTNTIKISVLMLPCWLPWGVGAFLCDRASTFINPPCSELGGWRSTFLLTLAGGGLLQRVWGYLRIALASGLGSNTAILNCFLFCGTSKLRGVARQEEVGGQP